MLDREVTFHLCPFPVGQGAVENQNFGNIAIEAALRVRWLGGVRVKPRADGKMLEGQRRAVAMACALRRAVHPKAHAMIAGDGLQGE